MTVGLDPFAIAEALAQQLRDNISRDIGVASHPNSRGADRPLLEVWPSSELWVNYHLTYGPDGAFDLLFEIRGFIDTGDPETAARQASDFAASGTGNTSSVHDAVHVDPTLGGRVAACVVGAAFWDPGDEQFSDVVRFPVRIVSNKIDAEV